MSTPSPAVPDSSPSPPSPSLPAPSHVEEPPSPNPFEDDSKASLLPPTASSPSSSLSDSLTSEPSDEIPPITPLKSSPSSPDVAHQADEKEEKETNVSPAKDALNDTNSSTSASSPSPLATSTVPHIDDTTALNGPLTGPLASLSAKERDVIILKTYKHEQLIRTLFGATFHCKCIVNDEVRLTVWILAAVGAACVLGFLIANIDINRISPQVLQTDEERVGVAIAATFTIAATILSVIQIRDHYNNWIHPPSQRCVVRILMMVPVYSISALLSLILIEYSLYIDFIRGCYEAFVIYEFVLLLTKYLGGDQGVVECLRFKPPLAWPAPMGCFPKMNPDKKFLAFIKYGTLQYTVLNPVCSVFAITMDMFGLYDDGVIDFGQGYVYVAFIQNMSQLLALYCLVWFYVVLKNELAPFKPMSKFLVVKSVVFFTFWQSVGLAVLVDLAVFSGTAEQVSREQIGIQDLLVCFEMFLAAAAHKYTFGYETYANGTIKLLMDQRALYIADLHYKRAKEAAEAQEKERMKQLHGDGSKALSLDEAAALAAGMAMPMPKKKKGKKKTRKSTMGGRTDGDIPMSTLPSTTEDEHELLTKEAIEKKIHAVASQMENIDEKLQTATTPANATQRPSLSLGAVSAPSSSLPSSYFPEAPFSSRVRNEYGEVQQVRSALPGLEDIARMGGGVGVSAERAKQLLKHYESDEGSALMNDDDIGLSLKLAPVTKEVTGLLKSATSSAYGLTSSVASHAATKFTALGKNVSALLKAQKSAKSHVAPGASGTISMEQTEETIKQENKIVSDMANEVKKKLDISQGSAAGDSIPSTPHSATSASSSSFFNLPASFSNSLSNLLKTPRATSKTSKPDTQRSPSLTNSSASPIATVSSPASNESPASSSTSALVPTSDSVPPPAKVADVLGIDNSSSETPRVEEENDALIRSENEGVHSSD